MIANNIKLSQFMKEMIKPSYIPSIDDLLEKGIEELVSPQIQLFTPIVDDTFESAKEDIPYLGSMILLMITLPWRFFYIRKALFMMKDNKKNRNEFVKLLKKVAKDYECILLYLLLIFSIIKTRRAIRLFIRNAKINFYVGLLKYSASN